MFHYWRTKDGVIHYSADGVQHTPEAEKVAHPKKKQSKKKRK